MRILVANIGSTSFKYRLYDMESSAITAQGKIERVTEYQPAISQCLREIGGVENLDAVGFKAVHAGPLTGARIVDDQVLSAMEEYTFLAPAHNPPYLAAMRAFRTVTPDLPLVALFETAFFESMSEAAVTYPAPYSWREELGVRRYGFHGASHRAASERAQQLMGASGLRHISCHLGGSSSLAAIRDGVAVDTSFGISAQSGIPHNNRAGDIDAAAALFVMKKTGRTVEEMNGILGAESGLLGVSGLSGDVRDLEAAAKRGNLRARLALDVFVRAIRHYLGAFMVELGGVDVLTFSGGIGENSPEIRAAVCKELTAFGIELDQSRNATARDEARISRPSSPVAIFVVPADEERIVARAAAAVLNSRIAVG